MPPFSAAERGKHAQDHDPSHAAAMPTTGPVRPARNVWNGNHRPPPALRRRWNRVHPADAQACGDHARRLRLRMERGDISVSVRPCCKNWSTWGQNLTGAIRPESGPDAAELIARRQQMERTGSASRQP